uniref:GDSL-type esterase/lipase family protein n=1 Tax=Shewanella gaetbuli TaxID=220752 RepID=UPI003B5A46F1
MKNNIPLLLLFSNLVFFSLPSQSSTFEQSQCKTLLTSEPRSKDYPWMSISQWYEHHHEDTKIAASQNVDVLFLGDSITAAWPNSIWSSKFAPINAVNFGIGGDTTENLLWRLQNGNAAELSPKVVNLLIGVNNLGLSRNNPQQTFCSIISVVVFVQRLYPQAEILVNQLLPWGELPDGYQRKSIQIVNELLANYPFSDKVHLFKFGQQLLDSNGVIDKNIMADFLHPTFTGYQIYAEHLSVKINDLLLTPNKE